ncbi:MAG: Holliday junction branch migration protein RuvA [Planctomycetes bacterium]|jgi:Holliday junction DNA helicase RuvA|nr:Holliday junction branch migration protein RuvA [Planctomycetota bacterium]
MIAYLKGKIIAKTINYVILDTNNVGYQVFVNETVLNEVKSGREIELYIHEHIREDMDDLYGFKTLEELELFELLLSVSGVGPKSALGILVIASCSDIKESIIKGDAYLLTKVSGIGKKTAERVVLELKEKLSKLFGSISAEKQNLSGEEIDALVSLGYSLNEAREALKRVDKNIENSSQRIKEALKIIGR